MALVVVGLVSIPALSPVHAAALYGPGRHWIDKVTGGLAMFESAASVGVDINGDGSTDLTVTATGPTTIFRSDALAGDPIGAPGHRNHLDLEIVTMTLTGIIPGLGPFTLTAGDGIGNQVSDGPLHSAGTSDEVPGSPRRALDVFEISFQLSLDQLGLVLHNPAPLRVETIITALPPIGAQFVMAGPPVPLVTANGAPVLQVTETVNRLERPPDRECDPDGLDTGGIAAAEARISSTCKCVRASHPRPSSRCMTRALTRQVRAGLLNRRCKGSARAAAVQSACGAL
jgi:hypothetical protein